MLLLYIILDFVICPGFVKHVAHSIPNKTLTSLLVRAGECLRKAWNQRRVGS